MSNTDKTFDNKNQEKIKTILDILLQKLDLINSIKFLLNSDLPYVIQEKQLVFTKENREESVVYINRKSTLNFIVDNVLSQPGKFTHQEVIFYLKHNFTTHLSDIKKSHIGKYYTPGHLVKIIAALIKPYVQKESVILDPACGCGAFLDNNKFKNIIGRDIDKDAVEVLKILGFENVESDNFLHNICRSKYGINPNSHLIIIGNPPYNDWTSKNKKYGKNIKRYSKIEMDEGIRSKDLGLCFLRAFERLEADVVCVLHPLSYLMKYANFRKLKDFSGRYKLKKGIVFSSGEFNDTQLTPFPVVAALYIRGNMDYNHILNFKFNVLNSKSQFSLGNIETIDGYIRKYPPRKKDEKVSDIGLYMYNIRDINSLRASGNLTHKEGFNNQVTIHYRDLYKYAYLNCMKRYFGKDFLLGNLSPVVEKDVLENDEYMRDLFIIDTIINNQRIPAFDIDNPQSIIYTKELLKDYANKMKRLNREKSSSNHKPDIYQVILNLLEHKNIKQGKLNLKKYIKKYFDDLKTKIKGSG